MTRIPYDLTREFQAHQRARRRNRAISLAGAIALFWLIGIALGGLAIGSSIHLAGIIIITAWGSIGLHYLLTRH